MNLKNVDVPSKPKLSRQLLASALLLLVIGLALLMFSKLFLATIAFLLSAIAGIGGRVTTGDLGK